MGVVIAVVIVVVAVLWILTKCVNSINKSTQKIQGRARCAYCKSRLKAVNGRYGEMCPKCGSSQPWSNAA